MRRVVAGMLVGVVCAVLVMASAALLRTPPLSLASTPSSGDGMPPSAPPRSAAPASNTTPPSSNATSPAGNMTPPAGNVTPPSNATSGNLTLTMTTDTTIYSSGQAVHMVLTITNTGSENETVPWGGCNPYLVVTNASGVVVYDELSGLCPLVVSSVTLAPGQSWHLNETWQQETNYGSAVPPGAYTLAEYWSVGYGAILSASACIEVA